MIHTIERLYAVDAMHLHYCICIIFRHNINTILVWKGLFVTFGPTKKRYVTEWKDAEVVCRQLGAQLATEDEILDVKAAGSTCCECGWTSSGRPRYFTNIGGTWCPLEDLHTCANWFGRKQNVWCQRGNGKGTKPENDIQADPWLWHQHCILCDN